VSTFLCREGAQAQLQATAGPALTDDGCPRSRAGQLLLTAEQLYLVVASGSRSATSTVVSLSSRL